MSQEGKIDELLSSLKIPMNPPDKSQWRKLELAMRFINKSRCSAKETRKRKESLKLEPKNLGSRKEDSLKNEQSIVVVPRKKNWDKIRTSLDQIM